MGKKHVCVCVYSLSIWPNKNIRIIRLNDGKTDKETEIEQQSQWEK